MRIVHVEPPYRETFLSRARGELAYWRHLALGLLCRWVGHRPFPNTEGGSCRLCGGEA